MISLETLSKLMEYNPRTGSLVWISKIYRGHHAVGDQVGYIHNNENISYYRTTVYGTRYLAHKLCVLLMTGVYPEGVVDHIDGNGLNNKWNNLRVVTNAINGRNCKINKNNTTGHIGVNKFKDKFRVRLKHEGKEIHIGIFNNIDDAVVAAKEAYAKYGFHPNHGRSQ